MKNRKLPCSYRSRDNIIADVSVVASRMQRKRVSRILSVLPDALSEVKCEWGAEIFLLPDVRVVSRAIEVQVAEIGRSRKTLRMPLEKLNAFEPP
jgi:hypothetical protein